MAWNPHRSPLFNNRNIRYGYNVHRVSTERITVQGLHRRYLSLSISSFCLDGLTAITRTRTETSHRILYDCEKNWKKINTKIRQVFVCWRVKNSRTTSNHLIGCYSNRFSGRLEYKNLVERVLYVYATPVWLVRKLCCWIKRVEHDV